MEKETKKKTNRKFIIIVSALVLVGAIYGGYKYIHSLSHEETDDAQIRANMTPIIPHVSGYLKKVYVTDNNKVNQGDTLFVIESQDYQVQFEQAKANLAAAESEVAVSKASIGSYQANANASRAQLSSAGESIETARVKLRRASDDFERYKNLYANHSITAQQFEQAEAAKEEAQNQLAMLKNQERASASQSKAASSQTEISEKQVDVAHAKVKAAQAQLEAAKINLGYTVVTAPIAGQLSNVDIQQGQFVSPGQALFYLVNSQDKWVIANFKETQLTEMLLGQKVGIDVDAYPDTEFEGEVAAFSPATGARFSLLPPDNATGNFVKTVQRLPVKINFTNANDQEKLGKLRSGMNVNVDVHLK
ncbi:HlyD family secretion protein [Flavimarina sp. Hel_I_48]|uniref:HlyD family secretion protein n=1 Tax=Flavimarina sp. Hel_I_48 TaxID=1392488 RepID=UPI0004DF42EF|nr:HlyD family secretion protein [Flavimarina sp. Hel_I_48]